MQVSIVGVKLWNIYIIYIQWFVSVKNHQLQNATYKLHWSKHLAHGQWNALMVHNHVLYFMQTFPNGYMNIEYVITHHSTTNATPLASLFILDSLTRVFY